MNPLKPGSLYQFGQQIESTLLFILYFFGGGAGGGVQWDVLGSGHEPGALLRAEPLRRGEKRLGVALAPQRPRRLRAGLRRGPAEPGARLGHAGAVLALGSAGWVGGGGTLNEASTDLEVHFAKGCWDFSNNCLPTKRGFPN